MGCLHLCWNVLMLFGRQPALSDALPTCDNICYSWELWILILFGYWSLTTQNMNCWTDYAGTSTWLKVHPPSWMILFLLIHILMSCTCHLHFHVQRDLGGLLNLRAVIPLMVLILKMGRVVISIMFGILNVLAISKK